MPYFNTAIEFIHGVLKKGGRVLVHCAMGQSRCPHPPTPLPLARACCSADERLRMRKMLAGLRGCGADACAFCGCRSASIVIAYVMATKQLDAEQATECVRFCVCVPQAAC